MTHETPGDAVAALEDLRDAVRNVMTLADTAAGPNVMRDLAHRFDADLHDAMDRADKVLDGIVAAAEDAALNAEEE